MNRLGEILRELVELNAQAANMNNSIQEVDGKRQELTIEWQSLCTHPEEYVDQEQVGNKLNTICRACSKIITSNEIPEEAE